MIMIIGIGTDIVSVKRIEKALNRWGARFKKRIYTQNEIIYCESKRFPAPHFAVRFSAKEAFYKALGRHQMSGIRWREIEVRRGENGMPTLNVFGIMKASLESMNYHRILLSLTHDDGIASAIVVIEG